MLDRFTRKRVLITGGASGLGKALVENFCRLGWQVAIADVELTGAKNLASELGVSQDDILLLQCDVTKDSDFRNVSDAISSNWQGVDVIINNAGIASSGFLEATSLAQWQRTLDVNLNGVFRGLHFWRDLLPQRSPGYIVNVASFAGIALAPGMLSYNVSKAAVIALSESLRIEMSDQNIGVSVACPAFFKTNLVSSMSESSETTRAQVSRWMEASAVSADGVAQDIIQAIERNRFMVISHPDARKIARFKRWVPERFFKQLAKKVAKLRQNQL